MEQEQGTMVPPETAFEDILDKPGHVIVVHLPQEAFPTSLSAERAVAEVIRQMCAALEGERGLLGPVVVAMENRQGSERRGVKGCHSSRSNWIPADEFDGSDPNRPTELYDLADSEGQLV